MLTDALLSDWTFEPWVVVPVVLSIAIHACGTFALWRRAGIGRGVSRGRVGLFLLGMLAIVIALMSPLDEFGERYVSAHMIQHELLMIVAAPLLVLSRPLEAWTWGLPPAWRRNAGKVARTRIVDGVWTVLTTPLIAWLLHALAIWLWHAPAFFQTALKSETIHALQHASFLATALLFWWVTLPARSSQPRNADALLYLFTTMLHTEALGAILVFSSVVLYPVYIAPGSLTADALQDQQLAGLVMWIPGGIPYLIAGLFVVARWLAPSTKTVVAARP